MSRQVWLDEGLAILGEGAYPPQVGIDEVCGRLGGIAKSSAYNYFGSAEGYYAAVAEASAEARERAEDVVWRKIKTIRDPLSRLRFMRGMAEDTAVADRAMRAWAATAATPRPQPAAEAAAAALERARRPRTAAVHAALVDLGLSAAETDVMTGILVREYGCGPGDPSIPPGDDARFDVLLSLAAKAAPVEVSALEVPEGAAGQGAVRMYIIRRGAPDDAAPLDSQELAAVREFAERLLAPAPDAERERSAPPGGQRA